MKKTKFSMLSMALVVMLSMPTNVLAADTELTNSSGATTNIQVTSELESTFCVGVPTEVIIDPSTNTGSYQISVKGDLNSKYKLKVSAVDSYTAENGDITADVNFLLKDVSSTGTLIAKKNDIVVNVLQDKTEFIYSDLNPNNPISVNAALEAKAPITAGKWKSTVTYEISLAEIDSSSEPETSHNYDVGVITTSPTCTEDGVKTFTCSVHGGTKTEPVAKLGHDYGEPTYVWNEHDSCTASRTCSRCSNVDSVTVDVTSSITGNATCTTSGSTTYTATFSTPFVTQTKVDSTSPAATSHSYGNWSVVSEPTCDANGSKQRECSVCHDIGTAVIPMLGHDYAADYTVDREATCTEAGSKSQHCSRCDSKQNVTSISALGHDLSSNVTSESTCTTEGNRHFECSRCDYEYDEAISAKGHTYNSANYVVDVEATCTEAGMKSVHCDVCGAKISGTEAEIPVTGHFYGKVTYNWSSDGKSCTATRTCATNSSHKETENATITSSVKTAATCTEKGTTTYTASFTNPAFSTQTKDVQDIAVTGHNAVDGYCTVCGERIAGLYDASGSLLCTWEESGIDNTCSNARTVIRDSYPTAAKVDIPDSVTSIGISAFNGCTSLTSIDIPDSVTSIGNYSFNGCTSLTSIDIPDSITSIGANAFRGCTSLTSIDIPDSVTSIGMSAFKGCTSLTSIDIPDSVTSIGISAFNGCTSLTSIDIPDSVTSIGADAFFDCTSLTSIDIPDSVTSIGISAFNGCTSLTNVTFENTSGWYANTVMISSFDLSNPSTAATYLKSTHSSKCWIRK